MKKSSGYLVRVRHASGYEHAGTFGTMAEAQAQASTLRKLDARAIFDGWVSFPNGRVGETYRDAYLNRVDVWAL